MTTEHPIRTIDLAELSGAARYFLMISAIVPRPIAWVSSVSASGVPNLAPFSFFQGVSSTPPILMLAISRTKSDGQTKDTLANILETREFVVGSVCEDDVQAAVASSAELPADESEFAFAGVPTRPSSIVRPAGIATSGVNLECRLHETHEIGNSTAVFGEILLAHVREDLLDERGVVDPDLLRPAGRLGGSLYQAYGRAYRVRRPA